MLPRAVCGVPRGHSVTVTPLAAERGAGGGRALAGGGPAGPAAPAPGQGQRRRLAPPDAGAAGGTRPGPPQHPPPPHPRLWPPPGGLGPWGETEARGGHPALLTPWWHPWVSECPPPCPQAVADVAGELQGLQLQTLSVGGLEGDGDTVEQGFRGCLQVQHGQGTWDTGCMGTGVVAEGQGDVGHLGTGTWDVRMGAYGNRGGGEESGGYGHGDMAQDMGTGDIGTRGHDPGAWAWGQGRGDTGVTPGGYMGWHGVPVGETEARQGWHCRWHCW